MPVSPNRRDLMVADGADRQASVATGHAPQPARDSDGRAVVLVREGRWPGVAGVCCWRSSVRAAFTEAGGRVEEITWVAPGGWRPARQGGTPSRRRRFMAIGRAAQRRMVRAARRVTTIGADRPIPPRVDHADLVITETVDAALALAVHGVPRHRIWSLALPVEHVLAGGRSVEARKIAHAATKIGGFLTDSEDARAAVERATAGRSRTKVVIFPPLAVDRLCPECEQQSGGEDASSDDPAVGQLQLWRRIIDAGGQTTAPSAYSYAAVRMLGPTGVTPPVGTMDTAEADYAVSDTRWGAAAGEPATTWPPPGWAAADQAGGAREVLSVATEESLITPQVRPRRLAVVAGFDLKFIRELAEHLDRRADLDLAVDEWPGLSRHGRKTLALTRPAHSVVAEWARPSAVWLARNKRPGQFLVVRLHRYEITTQYPRDIPIDNVDAVVYISPLMGRRIRDELGWPTEKLIYIPNFLDVAWFDRPKPIEARFMLGLVGIVPRIKRLDLALDLLAAVRREDPRFRLVVRSAMPWTNPYIWPRPEERDYFGWCFDRMDRDPSLRGSVIFDAPGRDMARWFSGIGHILSTSDVEGGHTVVAEGMASGAVPVIRPWAGAAEVYGWQWIHPSINVAATYILEHADAEGWTQRSAEAKAEVRATHDPRAVISAWADLLHGDLAGAKQPFPQLGDSTEA